MFRVLEPLPALHPRRPTRAPGARAVPPARVWRRDNSNYRSQVLCREPRRSQQLPTPFVLLLLKSQVSCLAFLYSREMEEATPKVKKHPHVKWVQSEPPRAGGLGGRQSAAYFLVAEGKLGKICVDCHWSRPTWVPVSSRSPHRGPPATEKASLPGAGVPLRLSLDPPTLGGRPRRNLGSRRRPSQQPQLWFP